MDNNMSQSKQLLGYEIDDAEQFQALVQELKREMLKGRTAREVLELPADEMESIYSLAYQKYRHGEYQKAVDLFRYLMVLDSACFKYILGLAASLHRLEEYQGAANHYLLASFYEPSNPIPYFHGAECYLRLGNTTMAKNGLTLAMTTAGDQEEFRLLKERAALIKSTLETNI